MSNDLELHDMRELAIDALFTFRRHYVNTLELARDRILDLGGQCDSLDDMIKADTGLRELDRALDRLQNADRYISQERLLELGWQRTMCGACGSDMCRAAPVVRVLSPEQVNAIARSVGIRPMESPPAVVALGNSVPMKMLADFSTAVLQAATKHPDDHE